MLKYLKNIKQEKNMKIWCLFLLISTCAFADESILDGTDPLTNQEFAESELYLHNGKADAIYKEQCVNEDNTIKAECSNDTSSGFEEGSDMQKLEKMMPIVNIAYAQFAGMLPIKYISKKNGSPILTDGKSDYVKQENGDYTNKDGAKVSPKDDGVEKKSKEDKDYCGMIPQVGSTAVTVYEQTMDQTTQQNLDNSSPQTRQAASFQSLAKAHKDRSKTAEIQMGIWGATGACYTGMLVTQTIKPNPGAIVKTGAALLLTRYFQLKKKAHKEKASILEKMASEYPGAGDCNPHTETTCFCNEESSPMSDPKNYQSKCVPKGYQKSFGNNSFICINAAGKADLACDCKANGSCIESKFKTMGMKLGLNPSMMRDPLAGISPLSNGFGTNGLDSITNKNLAFSNKGLKKIRPDNLSKLTLTNKQKKLAKDLYNAGVPKSFASVMAKSSKGGSAPSIATSGLSGGSIGLKGKGMRNAFQAAKKVKYGKSGRLKKRRGKRGNSRFGKFRKKGRKGVSGVEIMDFATRAQREAEISKDKSRPIFDIITYRYKASAWREFKDEINKQIKEDETQKK